MAEYIERESVEKFIMDGLNNSDVYERFGHDAIKTIAEVHYMPAADVAPVRHGRWVEHEKYTFGTLYDCSICGNRILDNGHSWNYCPNCGCRMDGGANNG